MSGFPHSTMYLCQHNWYIWKSIPFKWFDENTAVYSIFDIPPNTNYTVLLKCNVALACTSQFACDRVIIN